MRRFRWPLQRLLDVTVQRERALQGELLSISREMARLRRRILAHQAMLRGQLEELSRERLGERIPRQQVFLSCAGQFQRRLGRLREELKGLERRRQARTAEFLRARASREVLERRRAEARQVHLREQLKLEQKDFDEAAHVGFARRPGRLEPQERGLSSPMRHLSD